MTGRPPINPLMPFVPEYPFPRLEYGETLEVAPGVHWIRMPLHLLTYHLGRKLFIRARPPEDEQSIADADKKA